jgi:hypothetical protein
MPHIVDLTMEEFEKDKVLEEDGLKKLAVIEERMRAIKWNNLYDPIKATEMCLMPNMVIPKKFRVPKFVKYTGTQCPITHLRTYCNKMVEVVHDEKLLIHFF